jgi:hypothetical protein
MIEQRRTRRKVPPLSPDKRLLILTSYQQGSTIRELVEKYDSSYCRIHMILSRSNVEMRPKGPRKKS